MNLRDPYSPYAPWNDVDVRFVTCPKCCGTRGTWWDREGDKSISHNAYRQLTDEERRAWHLEPCEWCDGTGEVEEDSDLLN